MNITLGNRSQILFTHPAPQYSLRLSVVIGRYLMMRTVIYQQVSLPVFHSLNLAEFFLELPDDENLAALIILHVYMDQMEPPLTHDDVMESWHASPQFKHDFQYTVKTAKVLCTLKVERDLQDDNFLQTILPSMESHFLQLCWICEDICQNASKIRTKEFSKGVLKGQSIVTVSLLFLTFVFFPIYSC